MAEASADTVEQSTTIFGEALPEMSPSGPVSAEMKSAGVLRAVKTMSHWARSAMDLAALAPSSTSGTALAAVRLYTVTSQPCASRRRTIAAPILPVPSQPS